VNVNQLFPRLSIRAKLTSAFVLLAIVPLVTMATLGVRHTIRQVRALARATLENDLAIARTQTERALQEAERDVEYLASDLLGPLLRQSPPAVPEEIGRSVRSLLRLDPALFRVKVIDANGRLLFSADDFSDTHSSTDRGEEGLYYFTRASALRPGERLLLPVELRSDRPQAGPGETVPAIAILTVVRGRDGAMRGVVVGEARASVLFAPLDAGSPQFASVTGLVDAEGWYLYHSAFKRDWASLLASRSEVDITSELPPDAVEVMLSGKLGETFSAASDQIVSFVRLGLDATGMPPLVLYRVVPSSALEGGVRSFMGLVGLGGLLISTVVIGLGTLAAHQFTQPIYELRRQARRLAKGEFEGPLGINTGDELEDLAEDFSVMASSLAEQRQRLKILVQERTHALREVHAELAGILEHSADAILGLDVDGVVRVWNEGAVSLFGYTAAEAHGRRADDLILPSGDRWREEAAFLRDEAVRRGAVVNYQTRRANRDGESNPVSLTQSVIRGEDGEPIGYSLILRDTRMQARLEEQMRRSEALATMSVMTAGLAHELGNPLAVISNRIECMEREVGDRAAEDPLLEDLAVLREHVSRLDGVIRDVLSLSRENPDSDESVRLGDVAANAVRLLERTYTSRDVRLETDLDERLPPLDADRKAIETVCVNLLMNALDATPPGGTVSVRTRPSGMGTSQTLEVGDTGCGVPPELQRRIFEPFYTTKKTGRGTGLGLAVCRSIVERHGGTIRVDSRPGHGSRFVVTIPVHRLEIAWPKHAS
jgi:PAS domain S-box-containing protein